MSNFDNGSGDNLNLSPRSIEAEEAVLGSILINPDVLDDLTMIEPDDFFVLRNAWVFAAILALRERDEAIDNLTVVNELKLQKRLDDIGGPAYITFLINNTPTHIHAETYAQIVERSSIRRQLLSTATKIGQAALNENAEIAEVIEEAELAIETVAMRGVGKSLVSGVTVVDSALTQLMEWFEQPAEVRGLRTGIPRLDALTGGLMPGHRPYTFYGDTGMGKSTLAAFIAINLAEQGEGLIIPTEIPDKFWILRAAADLAGVNFKKLKSGYVTAAEKDCVFSIYDRLHRLAPCFEILKGSTPTPANIKAAARRLARQGRLKWILVDSVNNITLPGVDDIYQRTSAAAALTQYLALDLDTVVIQTSQVGRNAKLRENKMPQLHDAEGSGKIEQNSSWVFGLYRHQYYVNQGVASKSNRFLPNSTLLTTLKSDEGEAGRWTPLLFESGGFAYDEGFETRGKAARATSDDNMTIEEWNS